MDKTRNINKINTVTLYEEYRLIERSEVAINRAWKGAHLLLFFLAFVFGSFCTFCFHMLMYLFDEKCVLFPKLLSLTSLRHNVIYEYIPSSRDLSNLPVDFLSTQWVEKSTCALPTYVPLVSGIFGLVWTTMFLMCSTGSRTLTGLQRPWRVLPPVFVFSFAMGALCVYSSAVTHYGLQELCVKLGEITGSSTCTYTVNVATLTYERRIRGVYQATRLTIVSAWLHTFCWLCSALLAAVRVLLGVDFQLVRVSVRLHGDIDRIMEQNETQIRTIFPDNLWLTHENETELSTVLASKGSTESSAEITEVMARTEDKLFDNMQLSELSLVPAESYKLARLSAYKNAPKGKQFIVEIVYDLVESLNISDNGQPISSNEGSNNVIFEDESKELLRQFGRQKVASRNTLLKAWENVNVTHTLNEGDMVAQYIGKILLERVRAAINAIEAKKAKHTPVTRRKLQIKSNAEVVELPMTTTIDTSGESVMNITDEMKNLLKHSAEKDTSPFSSSSDKSDDRKAGKHKRHMDTQTEILERRKPKRKRKRKEKPVIQESTDESSRSPEERNVESADKETQTKKEKQD